MNNLPKQLGKLQSDIYWHHDSKDFDELSKAASSIYIAIGKDVNTSKTVGDFIAKTYKLADEAENAQKACDSATEDHKYMLAQSLLNNAEGLLDNKRTISHYQIKWWKCFRHKQTMRVVYNIFMQHLMLYGISGFFRSIALTYFLINVGLGHNKRDRNMTETYAEKYWILVLNNINVGIPFLG